jgi:phosphate starvation-inducible PhoH-like protein
MTSTPDPNERIGRREARVDLGRGDHLILLGPNDANLRALEEHFDGSLVVRGQTMIINGSPRQVAVMRDVVTELADRVRLGHAVDAVTIDYLWARRTGAQTEAEAEPDEEPILYSSETRRAVRARTAGQHHYVATVRARDVVFAIGPAGTGKTFLAVVLAMDYLKRQLVDRVVLVRPAVEAGEQLGFLPGDLQEKINPYLRPLYDALADVLGPARIAKYTAQGIIEASPLAYMRGRTLNNAFVILDEAQNTTVGQMKMFLTRLGRQAKAVVTGDITQIDLPPNERSGLVHVREILRDTEGVGFVELGTADVLRHPLVRRIVDAFAEAEPKRG